MTNEQRESNPDVNTFHPESDHDVEDSSAPHRGGGSTDVEGPPDTDIAPVPPDSRPPAAIEEPPESERPPIGDIDDSPKKIASD